MTNSYNWSHRKLTDEEAEDVRKRYAKGGVTQLQLAKEHNVGEMVINRIIKNRAYKYPNPLTRQAP